MARGRFISNTLGESDRFANLDDHAQRMLYMLLVTHADAEGRLKANTRWIRGKVLTYLDYPEDQLEAALQRMHQVGLATLYQADGSRFMQIEKFHEHNKIRRDKDGNPTHESATQIPAPPSRYVATTESLRSDDVPTTAEVEVEVEVQDQVEVQEQEKQTSPTGDELQHLLDTYNDNRGQLPAAQKLTSTRKQKLKTLMRDLGGTEPTRAAIAIATKEVSNDDFWIKRGYGLDNLLAGQKVIQKAETAYNRGSFNHEQSEIDRILTAIGGP